MTITIPPIKNAADAEVLLKKYEQILDWCPEVSNDLLRQQLKNISKEIAKLKEEEQNNLLILPL